MPPDKNLKAWLLEQGAVDYNHPIVDWEDKGDGPVEWIEAEGDEPGDPDDDEDDHLAKGHPVIARYLRKFNPNHDKVGRFARASGGPSSPGIGEPPSPRLDTEEERTKHYLDQRRRHRLTAAKIPASKDWGQRKVVLDHIMGKPRDEHGNHWSADAEQVVRAGNYIANEVDDRWEAHQRKVEASVKRSMTKLGKLKEQTNKLIDQLDTVGYDKNEERSAMFDQLDAIQAQRTKIQRKVQESSMLRYADVVHAVVNEVNPIGGKLTYDQKTSSAPPWVISAIETAMPNSWLAWTKSVTEGWNQATPAKIFMADMSMGGNYDAQRNQIRINPVGAKTSVERVAIHEFTHSMQMHPDIAEAEAAYAHHRLGPNPEGYEGQLLSDGNRLRGLRPSGPGGVNWANSYSGRTYEEPGTHALDRYRLEEARKEQAGGYTRSLWAGSSASGMIEILTTGMEMANRPTRFEDDLTPSSYDRVDQDLAYWATGMLLVNPDPDAPRMSRYNL